MNLYLTWNINDQKEILKREIYKAGTPFKEEIKILVSIKGITAFLALAFIADIGDITRFTNVCGFNEYLGVAPSIKASGGKCRIGSINKKSRSLSRTLFTQSINHFADSSPFLQQKYNDLKSRRGVARARIAILRKTFAIMRQMLLSKTTYKWKDINNEYKYGLYELELARMQNAERNTQKNAS